MYAVMQCSISAVFGSDVSVQGCFFHLTQNTWRKVQELGLAETYRNDEDVKQFCGMVDALAFLPPDDVPAGVYTVNHGCNNVFCTKKTTNNIAVVKSE